MQLFVNRYSKLDYLIQRQALALGFVFIAGTDILTTYFGMTKYGLRETIPWTTWIIEHLGWEGTILRMVVFSLLILHLFRYQSNSFFKFFRIPAAVILVVYAGYTTINNLLLMWW
jgi:hypothetical protein